MEQLHLITPSHEPSDERSAESAARPRWTLDEPAKQRARQGLAACRDALAAASARAAERRAA